MTRETQPDRLPLQPSQPTVRSASTLLLLVMVLLFTLGSLAQALHFQAGMIITQWGLILPPALWYLYRYRPFPAARELLNPLPLKLFPVIILLACSIWIILSFVESLIFSGLMQLGFELPVKIPHPETAAQYGSYIFSIVVSAGICEEVLFRGAILPSLQCYGMFPALLFSSLLFALVHMSFLSLPTTFILGLVIGLVVIKSGSLFAGILYHSINNFIVVTLMYGYGRYNLDVILEQNEALFSRLYMALVFVALPGAAAGFYLLQRFSAAGSLRRKPGEPYLPPGWLNWAVGLIFLLFLITSMLELSLGFGLFKM